MSDIVNTATILVEVDGSQVSTGMRQIVRESESAGQSVSRMGAGGAAAARNIEAAQRSIVQAIQRTTIAMEAGGKSTAAYYELLANQRGVDPAALAPYIAQLRAVEQAQAAVAQTAAAQQAEQLRAAESARVQAAAQRELAQVQATRDNFIASLREQVSLFGASTEEVLRYRAAQAGAADAAEPLIAQLRELRAAQDQSNNAAREGAEAARAQAAAQRELAQVQANRDAFVEGLREQIQLFGRSTDEVLQYRAAQVGASAEAAQLILQLRNMREAQEQVAQAARDQAEAQRLAGREQAGRDSFVENLREQAEAIGRTRIELLELRAAQLGVSDQAAPFITRLRDAEGGLNRTGQSAAATAAALRTVPAQFTDIITSLQGGQAPLTVLLQQGGQLRDQFGSTGAAARALGGYVAGLINPYTVAGAAAIALALAYKTGAEEASAYGKAIVLSGNAAGASVDQLAEAARQIAAFKGSQGAAAEAVAALASTGQVSVENMRQFGAVSVDVQKVIGRSVADTAAEFAELGKAPLAALDKINDKYRFITAATYAQVKALEDQGRKSEAATVAQQAYADGIDKQRQKVLDSLTDWERGWIRIKNATSGALDAVIGFAGGREATNFEKINSLLGDRADIEESLARARKRNLPADVAMYEAELEANKRAINAIRERDGASRAAAKAEADAAQVTEARNKWLTEGDKYLSRAAQLERDVTRARNEGAAAQLSQTEIEKRVSDIRKSYADIFNAGIDSNIAALKRRDQVADLLAQRELARIATQRALGNINEEEAINATAREDLAKIDRAIKSQQAELALIKQKANSGKDQADKEGEVASLREERENREKQRQNDLLVLQQRRTQATEDLYTKGIVAATAERNSLVDQLKAQFDLNQEIGLSTTQVAELRAARLQNAAALKDESAAALEAIDPNSQLAKTYREQAQAMRDLGEAQVRGAYKEQMTTQWKQAVDQYGQVFQQGFADMLNNGRAGWSSFTKSLTTTFKTSVADQIYKMFARPLIVQLVGSFMGISPTAIAGEIASQPNAYGVTNNSSSPIGAAQAASSLYSAVNKGFSGIGESIGKGFEYFGDKVGMESAGNFGRGMQGFGQDGSLGQAGAYGQSATSYVGQAAGAISGHYIGNAIAGDYSINHGQAVTNIASVVGAIVGGPIGGAIGGAIGGFINRAFGMKDKEVTSQGISGTLSASSLTGQNYANWHQDGGWFRSDKNGTDTSALTDAMVKQFTQGLFAIESASTGFASALGVRADWIKDYSKTFDLKLTGDAAKDQQAVTDFFQGIGDEIAGKLVPNLNDFNKSGETLSATLQRLAGDFQGTDKVAQLLGFSADTLFGASGLGGAKAREQLIDMAGGLSALSQYASTFNQNFLTDAERIKPVAEALDKALASLGLGTIPTTRDEFKALVNDLISSGAAATESGAKQLDSLLALGEAFAQVHPAVDAVADAAAAAAAAAEKAAAALQAVKDSASALLGNVDGSFSVLQKVVGREKAAVQTSIDTHTAAFNKLQSLSQSLHSTLDSLQSPEQKLFARSMAQAEVRADLAITKAGGSLSDSQVESLKKALGAVTQDASGQFSSYQDYLRDLYQTQNDIAQLGQVTDSQLSVEQQALAAAQDQLKALDEVLTNAQEQIDVLKGIDTNGLTLVGAMQALTQAIVNAKSNPIVGATSAINGAYQQYLGRAPDAQGLEWWQNAAANGAPIGQIVSGIAGSTEAELKQLYQGVLGRAPDAEGLAFWMNAYGPQMNDAERADWLKDAMATAEYKKLHPFAVGTNQVPYDMPAFIHKDERIIPAADNRALMARLANPSDNSAVLASTVKSLQETIDKQQGVMEGMAADMAAMAETLKNVAPGGFIRVKGI